MTKFRLNKLVRDKIPKINEDMGIKVSLKSLGSDEYRIALMNKLTEEVNELKSAKGKGVAKEIADILEVIDAVIVLSNIDQADISLYRSDRFKEAGGFGGRKFITTLEFLDGYDGPWVDYYRKDPNRFPEI